MQKKTVRVLVPVVAGLCAVGATVAWAQGSLKLVINGNPVTTSVKTIGGQKYVPISAVAKALKMNVYTSGNTITLRPAGGTFQVANKLQGKIGEDLFSGRFGFKVLSVQRGVSYKFRNVNSFQREVEIEAKGTEEIVVVNCRLKNGTKQMDNFAFHAGSYGMNTALTDTDEQSFAPAFYDVLADEPAPLGKKALPGSSINFSIVFRVPQGTPVKDLVYSVVRYSERGDNKSTDFRVNLQ